MTERGNNLEIEAQKPSWVSGLVQKKVLLASLLLILSAAMWYPRRHGPLDLRWDSSVYYVLGTSLAQGSGYRLLNEPGNIHAVQYPPLTSAVIALHQIALKTSDPLVVATWLKLTWFLCSLFVIAATYIILGTYLPQTWAAFGALLCLLNLPTYLNFSQASAEAPFTVVTMAFLLAYRRTWSPVNETIAGITAAAGFFARTIGIALLVAWVADALLRKQFRRAALRGAVALLCVITWQGYIRAVELSREYTSPAYAYQRADYMYPNVSYARNISYKDPYRPELGRSSALDVLKRFSASLLRSPQRFGEGVTSYKGRWEALGTALNKVAGVRLWSMPVVSVFLFGLGSMVLAGLCILLKRGDILIPVYVFTTLIMVCAVPWPVQHVRYVSPLVPLMILGLFIFLRTGAQMVARTLPGGRRAWHAGVIALLVFIPIFEVMDYFQAHTSFFAGEELTDRTGRPVIYKQLFYGKDLLGLDESIKWITTRAQRGDLIAASMPQWVYLRTGLKSVMPPLEANPGKADKLLESVPVRYLIEETPEFFSWRYVDAVTKAYPDEWHLVFTASVGDVHVYRRVTSH